MREELEMLSGQRELEGDLLESGGTSAMVTPLEDKITPGPIVQEPAND